jgi:hypothetical protein
MIKLKKILKICLIIKVSPMRKALSNKNKLEIGKGVPKFEATMRMSKGYL